MEKQDKFNQPSVNEPMKQSVEQPTADTDSKSAPDETEDAEEDAEIIWDPKRPGCLDLKYYRKYWQDTASVFLIGFGLIFIIANLIIDLIIGKSYRTSIQDGIHVMSVIIPAATLMLMCRSAFRFRKAETLVLRWLQSAYTIICLSCILGKLLFTFNYGIMSAESGKIDLGVFFVALCTIISISSGILYSFSVLLEYSFVDKELWDAFPTVLTNRSCAICWTALGIMTLPIIVHIVLTIIAFG